MWVSAQSRIAVLTSYADAAARLDLADPEIGVKKLAHRFRDFLADAATPGYW